MTRPRFPVAFQVPDLVGCQEILISPTGSYRRFRSAGCRLLEVGGLIGAVTGSGVRRGRRAAATRSLKRERRERASAAPSGRATPGKHCPSHGAKCVPLLRIRNSLQLCVSGRSAGRRSARRRCALETVEKVVTGILS